MSTEEAARTGATSRLATLTKDLQGQVRLLVADLRTGAGEPTTDTALREEYARATYASRTKIGYPEWLEDRLVQVAASWVLACVFVRFSEDNGLIQDPWLSGPGERLAEAQDRHDAFFRTNPHLNDRDWMKASFAALADAHETAAGLFDRKFNPLWEIDPSYEAAGVLLAFWRELDSDANTRLDFTDPKLDTRFLGDLYQDLSEYAKKTYALLQTPVFVEKFILDLTLTPALEEFGLQPEWKFKPEGWKGEHDGDGTIRGLRCIDPACGSGHFLLGLFDRILAEWRKVEPGTRDALLIRRTLESIHGADKNPYAASIARFRLMVAVLAEFRKGEDNKDLPLFRLPGFPIRVAVGDSLLHGRDAGRGAGDTLPDGSEVVKKTFTYRTEDISQFEAEVDLLGRGSYHVVVANPPYIAVQDPTESANYRTAYWACSGKYVLTVPFAQRIFELAVRGWGSEWNGGFTGQITSNSFMKREFGKLMIESFFQGGPYKDPATKRKMQFSGVELTHVIDTSGAYIPGHGTPTVILAGRNQMARQNKAIRAVLGVRGETEVPEDGEFGEVWQAITQQVGRPGSESPWVTVEDAKRKRFADHPWSLSGGGAGDLTKSIEKAAPRRLKDTAESLGITCFTLEDDLYLLPGRAAKTAGIPAKWTRPMVTGEYIRDWSGGGYESALFPYSKSFTPIDVEEIAPLYKFMWPSRTTVSNNILFGRKTKIEGGLKWSEYGRLTSSKLITPLAITFAFVATHNQFVLDRGGNVFKQSAPVIKLPEGANEERHLELLGVLNSSAACFWLKQVSQSKGGADNSSGGGNRWESEPWIARYEFTGTKLQEFPLPSMLPLDLARKLDSLAQKLAALEPAVVTPVREALANAKSEQCRIRSRMIALQEELDWTVYASYGLLTPKELARTTLSSDDYDTAFPPDLALGQRAFEIVLAASDVDTAWFDRHHGSIRTTSIPPAWPEAYRAVVQARLDVIASNDHIRLIERPEYKRRWSTVAWKDREAAALRTWLQDAAEREDLWFEERDGYTAPRILSVNQLADALRDDDDVQSVAALYATDHLKRRDAPLATVLAAVLETEHVPYLAALRYKESGLRKRAQWEEVWEAQRIEDKTGENLGIDPPPKYSGADFLKHSFWSNRGKLDVPKERFVSYPDAGTQNDASLLLGWAGWNHRDQAQAIVLLLNDRIELEGWDREDPRCVPLVAGLLELMPWVEQWYSDYDDEWSDSPARELRTALTLAKDSRGLADFDLRAWRPQSKQAARRKPAAE